MTKTRVNKWKWRVVGLILGSAAVWGIYAKVRPVDEVVLTIGESYQQVREQSPSTLPVLTHDNRINLFIERPAVLRFRDSQYGFVTPAAKFLSLYANESGKVVAVTLSPQIDTLPLDEAITVFLGLQDQFRRGGWRPFRVDSNPPLETLERRVHNFKIAQRPRAIGRPEATIKSLSMSVASNPMIVDRTTSGT
jgi:hypothetical protein